MNRQDSKLTFPVSVTFTSDWGIGTGTGVVGGVDSRIERGDDGRIVVRATGLAGVIREQAQVVAEALDEGRSSGPWHRFVTKLFGTAEDPRLVAFSDAQADDATLGPHEVVSVSIDERTGAAKPDHLRIIERAPACKLTGSVTLLDTSMQGAAITWSDAQRDAALLVLSLAASLVPAIGSDRSNGDGACEIIVGEHADLEKFETWCRKALDHRPQPVPEAPKPSSKAIEAPRLSERAKTEQRQRAVLRIHLDSPVVSYAVPLSNEIPSEDFLRGTVLLPWVHGRLRQAAGQKSPDVQELVRDAVVNGDLYVSDALPVCEGVHGLPVPLVLTSEKGADEGATPRVWNRLIGVPSPERTHSPKRSGYVFPAAADDDTPIPLGAPPLVGRQATAHNPATGTAATGQLFLVRALPAGIDLEAEIILSERLARVFGAELPKVLSRPAQLGSRRLTGTFGRAHCGVDGVEPWTPADSRGWDEEGMTTLWFISDVLLRSPQLGAAGTLDDLITTLRNAGAGVERVDRCAVGDRYVAGLRHRRIDTWSAASHQPRATRVAIQAGSVIRVRPAPEANSGQVLEALRHLSCTGIGELQAQGFGRFLVGHPLLTRESFRSKKAEGFIPDSVADTRNEGEESHR
ncbi:CRISPR-associated protein Csx10 [Actinomyces ruminicola]|uniref:CRISPR-associated protein Csx10 n=1 Tax=Actinomyces ruminicola TaxID=332524 RepID=A0A1H0ETW9_9ACTO|nr:RAMP superfamily CRISPR-associated protein [Actinomyces ruminicola]SDN85828.1 CRISPR-associated protein Csx10 [Actinomyces ruminicola]